MTNEMLECGLFLFAHSFERLCVGHSSPRCCARRGEEAPAPAEGYFSGVAVENNQIAGDGGTFMEVKNIKKLSFTLKCARRRTATV